jgi:hypothetical protein
MIINGGSRRAGRFFARHLTNEAKNGRVELCEIRGLLADNVAEAFREMEAVACGTRCRNFFYHANINPRDNERLTPEQWEEAIDRLEHNLSLDGQPRFVIEHEKEGRVHRHVIWSRIDAESMKAISDSLTARIHERTSRELEEAFGLAHTDSVLVKGREPGRNRAPEGWAMFRAQDSGIDPRAVTAEVTELWQSADNGQAFAAALGERGYILAKGDRRDFVIIDPAGDEHSLSRRIAGARAAEVRMRMVDVDRESLPSVADAKELWEQLAASAPQEMMEAGPGPSETPNQVPDGEEAAPERQVSADESDTWLFDRYCAEFQRDIEEYGEIRHDDGFDWWERTVAVVLQWRDAAVDFARQGWQRVLDIWNGPDDLDQGPDGPEIER